MKQELRTALCKKGRDTLPRVLLAAAECAPLAKTGGLADVVGTLPKSLSALGIDARVIIPYHRVIKNKYAQRVTHMTDFYIDLGWRHQYVGLERLVFDGVVIYLIDNEFYFGDRIYLGGMPEGEQYAFFVRAVAEAIPRLDFQPDILHCNDWHTAMLPMLLKTQDQNAPQGRLKTLLTIHNIAYQGKFGFDYVQDLLGVDARYYTPEFMELDGCANFLKAGCVFADRINTVSPTYASEIRTAYFGEGLQGILSARQHQLSGILNGIDTTTFDPAHDTGIAQTYSAADRSGKAACKAALIQELGLSISPETPIVAMVTRMTAQKGFDLVQCVLDELMELDMAFVLLGTGDKEYEDFMRRAEWNHKGRVCAYIGYDEALSHRVYAGADFLLMPSSFEPCGLSQMIAMRYGTLPIVRETGGLRDSVQPYNRFTGEGTGFSFAHFNAHEMADAVRRAVALYHEDKNALQSLIRNAMHADFSFTRSAEAYAMLYLDLLPEDRTPKHDAADEAFRQPIGAVETGASVRLSLADPGGFVTEAALELYDDDAMQTVAMRKTETGFSCRVIAPRTADALFYRFRLQCADGTQWLCPAEDGRLSRLCPTPEAGFRLTVYETGFDTPAWFRKSVLYQIFPDRFARDSSNTAQRGVAHHRHMGQEVHFHEDWNEPVEWQPNTPEGRYAPIDFYGGTLRGIMDRLPYLQKLGVTALYLNPITEAASNHRYDTGDYGRVDPILGTNGDFERLCAAAEKYGIRILLDGVFSHTGADSKYFNRYKNYPGSGAYNSRYSPFYKWYHFDKFPDKYRCWWDFPDLPEVDKSNPDWQKRIITGENSVVKTWLNRGASGWRLDVADELPDEILARIRSAAKSVSPDAVILGEVWEDAVTKISYGKRRRYALGGALDSVMNYPLRYALIEFLRGRGNAHTLEDMLLSQRLNYPKPFYYALMNLTASHDIERTRTALSIDFDPRGTKREQQAAYAVTDEMAARGAALQKLAAVLQFVLPGVPSIYYGDETGMQGFCDPFNRAPYRMLDAEALRWYSRMAAIRQAHPALQTGAFAAFSPAQDVICILRAITDGADVFGEAHPDEALLIAVNRAARSVTCHVELDLPGSGLTEQERLSFIRAHYSFARDLLSEQSLCITGGRCSIELPAYSAAIFELEGKHGTET